MELKKYKIVSNGYIIAVGYGYGETEITESEYNEILSVLRSHPHREGFGYHLKTDLTWEEYEVQTPSPEETEVDDTEIAEAVRGIL